MVNFLRVIVVVVVYFLFWGICFLCTGSDEKNIKGFRSYPDEVQNALREDERFRKRLPESVNYFAVAAINALSFAALFFVMALCLKKPLALDDYLSAFIYLLILGEGLNAFDLLIIDLLWWRNTKRIRFSVLPEKSVYQNPKKHIDSFLRGIFAFAVSAAIGAIAVLI